MISDSQIFVVVDIEADGPAVGLNSMLSLAAVATTATEEVARFYRKLSPLPDAKPDPATMAWWEEEENRAAWIEATTDPLPPGTVMSEFHEWITALGREPIFASNPVALDYTFVSWYLARFAPSNPFKTPSNGTRALDIKAYVAGRLNLPFDKAKRRYWPPELTQGMPPHTHNALDDAAGYAVVLRNLMAMQP